MDTRSLKVGDRIRCNVRGQIFTARYLGYSLTRLGGHRIDDPDPKSVTYREVTARQIVGKVEGQERLEVRA
jgi:hypothetical protein